MNLLNCECRHCAGHLEFDPEYDGLEIDCSHCGKKTTLFRPGVILPPALMTPASKLMTCPDCGKDVSKRASSCPHCGAPIQSTTPPQLALPFIAQQTNQPLYVVPVKSRGVYIILGLFLGLLGIHNFYAGHNGRGAMQLLTTILAGWLIFPLIMVGIWCLIEVIAEDRDGQGVKMA
jgi:TM2 domain-containing membrane protein YozV